MNTPADPAIQDAVEWSLMHGMSLKTTAGSARHCAFSFAPTLIEQARFNRLKQQVPMLGKLIHGVSEDHEFLQQALAPVAESDPFFRSLSQLHSQLHPDSSTAQRIPLLFMRTDFMDDARLGPKLIEFNSIAAGMGPFGQRIHQLHSYLAQQWPDSFQHWSPQLQPQSQLQLLANPALELLSEGLASAARKIRDHFTDTDSSALTPDNRPVFLMVVQPDEDNVYDQHLLEQALRDRGIRTLRRSFRQLYDQLDSGPGGRLLLQGIGGIDCIYLRAGYQHSDYRADDLLEQHCCQALGQTRVFMEQHRVAINATISQQLATSKRVQMLLSSMTPHELTRFGLNLEQATQAKALLGEMRPVDGSTAHWFAGENPEHWVLKNQGEGGGHCVFGSEILPRLKQLQPEQYSAWALMRRLHPAHRQKPALIVRQGQATEVNDLISEIGLFTVHFDGQPVTRENGYGGYLIRSKPASVTEGGVHSGLGALDSLACSG